MKCHALDSFENYKNYIFDKYVSSLDVNSQDIRVSAYLALMNDKWYFETLQNNFNYGGASNNLRVIKK